MRKPAPICAPLGAALLTLIGAPTARAIVNMESLHLQQPKEGFSGEVELAASGASGNTDKSDVAFGARLEWHHERRTDFLVGNYNYGRAAGTTNTDNAFLHLRHVYQATAGLAWEGYGQLQRDRFARLTLRELAGGGARFTLTPRDRDRAAFLGLGAFHEREDLSEKAGTTDAGADRHWRGNFYWVFKRELRDDVHIVNSVYYQPALNEASDYRALDTAALQVDLTDRLALKIGLTVAYDNRPPQTVRKTDVTYRTGLAWSF